MMIRWLLILLILVWAVPVWSANETKKSVRELIIIGLDKNIGLQVESINVPVSEEAIKVEAAVFDTEFFAGAEYINDSTPQSLALSPIDRFDSDRFVGQMGLRKSFESGLAATFSLGTDRISDNNFSEDLDPRYRTALLLDLTQPLLRNFGSSVNTTQLQLSKNQNQQQSYNYFLQAQNVALQIETLAVRFASDTEIVKLRKEAVALANELYVANKRRFDSGVIPVSEVQEAQTDLANRELTFLWLFKLRNCHANN